MNNERSPEWLALIDAANAWRAAQDVYDTLRMRGWSYRDACDAERARGDVRRALDAWQHAVVLWEAANNRRRTDTCFGPVPCDPLEGCEC